MLPCFYQYGDRTDISRKRKNGADLSDHEHVWKYRIYGDPHYHQYLSGNGILYVSVFSIVDQLFLWTLGVKLTAPEGEGKFDLKKLVNPASIGIIVALFMILTGLKLLHC